MEEIIKLVMLILALLAKFLIVTLAAPFVMLWPVPQSNCSWKQAVLICWHPSMMWAE